MKDQRGFFLAELTVTLALLVVVLAVGLTFFFFSLRSYTDGEKKTTVQSNVRLAANYITKEIRYADSISPTDMAGIQRYGLKLDGHNLKQIAKAADGTLSDRVITREGCLTGLSFLLEENSNILKFTIKGNDGTLKKDITIESEVLLENLEASGTEIDGPAVYFTKPDMT